jgi:multiple sugar transport system substrate-binding protein
METGSKKRSWLREVAKVISPKYPTMNIMTSTGWELFVEEAAKLWNRDHPKSWLDVNIETYKYDSLKQRIMMELESEERPDIVLVDSIWLPKMAEEGLLTPLDKINPNIQSELLDSFFRNVLEADSWKGKVYGLRVQSDIPLLWYRKDWFEKEGQKVPETWDDLIQVALHFNEDSVKKKYSIEHPLAFVAGTAAGEETSFTMLPFFWSNGGDLIKDQKIILDSPQNAETLQFLKDLLHKYSIVSKDVVRYEWSVPGMLYAQGKVVMGIGGGRQLSVIQSNLTWPPEEMQNKFGYAPIPRSPKGKIVINAGGMLYAILDKSENKEVAFELIEYILSRDLNYDFCVKTGLLPTRKDVVPLLKSKFLIDNVKLLAFSRGRPSDPNYEELSKQFQILLERSISGTIQIEAALKGAAESMSFITGYPKE